MSIREAIVHGYKIFNSFFISFIFTVGNTLRVSYHLCIRHALGTMFKLYQSSENMHRRFHTIKTKLCIGHHMQRNVIDF